MKTSNHCGGKTGKDQIETENLSWSSDDKLGFQPVLGCQDKDTAVTENWGSPEG